VKQESGEAERNERGVTCHPELVSAPMGSRREISMSIKDWFDINNL
jgi:hypothetical protein